MERRKSGEETDALARMHIMAETLHHVCRILWLCFFPPCSSADAVIPFAIPLPSHPIHLVSILPRLRAPPPCPALPCPAPRRLALSSPLPRLCQPKGLLAPSCSCSPLRLRCRRTPNPRFRSSSSPPLQQPSPSSFLFLLLLYPQPQHPAQVRQTDRSAWGAPRRQRE